MASRTSTKVYSTSSADLVVRPWSATPLTADQRAAQSAFIQSTLDADKMAALVAERKRINEMINEQKATAKAERDAAKANEPSKLEREIARQEKSRTWLGVVGAQMVQARVKLGQSQDEAVDAILAMWRERVVTALANGEVAAEVAAETAEPVAAQPTAAQAQPAKTAKTRKAKSAE